MIISTVSLVTWTVAIIKLLSVYAASYASGMDRSSQPLSPITQQRSLTLLFSQLNLRTDKLTSPVLPNVGKVTGLGFTAAAFPFSPKSRRALKFCDCFSKFSAAATVLHSGRHSRILELYPTGQDFS